MNVKCIPTMYIMYYCLYYKLQGVVTGAEEMGAQSAHPMFRGISIEDPGFAHPLFGCIS